MEADVEVNLAGEPEAVYEAFERMPVAMVALEGPALRFAAANAAYRAIVGRSHIIGKPVREVAPEVSGQQLYEMLERVYASGERVIADEWRVQLNRGPDGEAQDVYLNMTILPRQDAGGRTNGLLVHITDASEQVRRRLEAERQAGDSERRYRAARDVVAQLQRALLPAGLPVLPSATVSAHYLVAAEDQAAGGDWFDAVPLPDGRLALLVGDVVGHGVAASAAMGQLRAILSEVLRRTGDAEEALRWADQMAARTPAMRSSTVCLAVLDPVSGALRYITCGHPPPLVADSDGSSRYLTASGAGPLGTGSPLVWASDAVVPGAVLVGYSDGLIERPGRALPDGMSRLARVAEDAMANRVMPAGAPESAEERVCQHCVELLTREGYEDDVTVIAVLRRLAPVPELRERAAATVGSFAGFRDATRAWLSELGAATEDERAVELIVTELIANAIEHAYPPGNPGEVRLRGSLGPDGVARIEVSDDGTWQEPSGQPPTGSGRGLWLAAAMSDDLRIEHADRAGTTVTVRCGLRRPATLGAAPRHMTERRPGAAFSVTIDPGGPPLVVRAAGPLDITAAAGFADQLDRASRAGMYALSVDLSGVDVLASSGVKALFAARERHSVHGHDLEIVAPSDSVAAGVLDLVGLPYHAPPV